MQRKIACGSRIKFDDVHIRHGASYEDGTQDVQCGRLCTTQNRWRWTADHAALEDYAWWSHCVQCGRLCTTQNRWRWTADHAALGDYVWWSHCATDCRQHFEACTPTCVLACALHACSHSESCVTTDAAAESKHSQTLYFLNRNDHVASDRKHRVATNRKRCAQIANAVRR
jgi:hypothetical protein